MPVALLGFKDEKVLLKSFTLSLVTVAVLSKGSPSLMHTEFTVCFNQDFMGSLW